MLPRMRVVRSPGTEVCPEAPELEGGVTCWGGNGVAQLGHSNGWSLPQPVLPPN